MAEQMNLFGLLFGGGGKPSSRPSSQSSAGKSLVSQPKSPELWADVAFSADCLFRLNATIPLYSKT